MIVALLLAAAQPDTADPFEAYFACNLDRARALIASGEPDDVVRDRSYEECYFLRSAAVRHLQARSTPPLSSGPLGMAAAGMDGAIERRVEELLDQRAAASGAAPEAAGPVPAAVQAYYTCAANRAELLAAEVRRPADEIVAAAIAGCAPLREPAIEQAVPVITAGPEAQAWLRARNIDADEARRLGEAEFDLALRRRLTMNVMRLRGGDGRPDREEAH